MLVKSISSVLSKIRSLQDGHFAYKVGATSITRSAAFTHDPPPHSGQTNLMAYVFAFSYVTLALNILKQFPLNLLKRAKLATLDKLEIGLCNADIGEVALEYRGRYSLGK
jgi:hypothetical protein